MANPTSRVQSTVTPWGDDKIKRPLAATAQTYYPGEMIALNSSGNATKCDDTAAIRFDGLQADSFRIEVLSGDSAGDKKVTVERPFRFTMSIAAAVAGDEGRAVYATYSNEVGYTSTNSILVGWVDKVIDATTVLIRPVWIGARGDANFDGETLTFDGASAGNTIVMPDNLADALSIVEGSNAYLTFVTTNSAEKIIVKKDLTFSGAIDVLFSGTTGQPEIKLTDNLADALSIGESTNDYIVFITTDSGEKVQFKKDLELNGAIDLAFVGTTGQPEIALTDNLADALSIKIPSGNDLMIFTTTDSAEKVTIPAAFVQGSDATDRVTVKGIYMNPSVVAVTVPSITDPDIARVQVSVASAFSMQPAVGDAVIAIPAEALPTNCRLQGAFVYQTDGIEIVFGSEGGNVTGAAKNFNFLVFDLT